MKIYTLFFLLFIPVSSANGWFLDSSKIRIANAAAHNIYAAIYYTNRTTGQRIAPPLLIPPNNALTIDLPSPKFLHSRLLLTAQSAHDLPIQKKINLQQAAVLGMFYASDYTVTINTATGKTEIIETNQWNQITKPDNFIPYQLTTTPLPDHQDFLSARTAQTLTTQQIYCDNKLTRPLNIGICASGGGFRAMMATAGVMAGLEKIGVLPLIQTCVGLSGSTWFLFPWILSAQTAPTFANTITHWLDKGLLHHLTAQYKDLAQLIATKKQHNLPVSGIDFYSINLAYTLLKPLEPNALALTMHDVGSALDPEKHPLIMGTMVTRAHPTAPYEWIITSPYCMQFINSKICLPPNIMGAYFYSGQQVTTPPAPLLSYYLAIFGSAPSASIRDALERTPDSLQKIINKIMPSGWHEASWSNTKITAAHIANPHYGLAHSPIKKIQELTLVDGGYLNNLPLEATIRTHQTTYDILICIDVNQHRDTRITRIKQAWNAIENQQPGALPPLQYDQIASQPFSIHRSTDSPTTIIYITVEGSDEYDPTFNPAADPAYATIRLIYPQQRAQRLMEYMSYVITHNKSTIRSLILESAAPHATKEEASPEGSEED